MNHAWYDSENRQQDVEQELQPDARRHQDGKGRQEDGEQDTNEVRHDVSAT